MLIGRNARRWSAPSRETVSAAGSAPVAPPPAECGAVLDDEALRRLAELDPTGANHLLERVFRAFEASTLRLIPQLNDAHRTGDRAGVRHVAHTLKSSSASIGAIKLAQLCAEIETMIRLDTLDGLTSHIEQMIRETSHVIQALRQMPGVPS